MNDIADKVDLFPPPYGGARRQSYAYTIRAIARGPHKIPLPPAGTRLIRLKKRGTSFSAKRAKGIWTPPNQSSCFFLKEINHR